MNINANLELFSKPPISVSTLVFRGNKSAPGLTLGWGWYCLDRFPPRLQVKYSFVHRTNLTTKLLIGSGDAAILWIGIANL